MRIPDQNQDSTGTRESHRKGPPGAGASSGTSLGAEATSEALPPCGQELRSLSPRVDSTIAKIHKQVCPPELSSAPLPRRIATCWPRASEGHHVRHQLQRRRRGPETRTLQARPAVTWFLGKCSTGGPWSRQWPRVKGHTRGASGAFGAPLLCAVSPERAARERGPVKPTDG